jgi:hypothetical protein
VNDPLAAALDYARRGWNVFPLHGIVRGRCTCGRHDCSSPGKHPITRHGVKDAASDPCVINEWWRRWPCANIAIATGKASGVAVIDIDLPLALGSLDVLVERVPRTLVSLSGGGGIHLLLEAPEDRPLHNHASRLPGLTRLLLLGTPGEPSVHERAIDLPGIDLRADGGYIVAPPSQHKSGNSYSWLDPDASIAQAPDWLREPPPRPIRIPAAPTSFTGDGTPYGLAALRNGLEELGRAPEGTRNHTLNRVAFRLGHLIPAGHLREAAVRSALFQTSVSIGLKKRETLPTMDSALRAARGE